MNCRIRKAVLALILIVILSLTSCGSMQKQGLDKFSHNDSNMSLTLNLIPENFIDDFEYVNGDYYYDDHAPIPFYKVTERVFLFLKYEESIYNEAKSYAMEKLSLSETATECYNEYIFFENYSEFQNLNDYPYTFIRFAYNDTKHTLIFLAFDVSAELHDEVDQYSNDWGAFLDRYYGEWYDFSQ